MSTPQRGSRKKLIFKVFIIVAAVLLRGQSTIFMLPHRAFAENLTQTR